MWNDVAISSWTRCVSPVERGACLLERGACLLLNHVSVSCGTGACLLLNAVPVFSREVSVSSGATRLSSLNKVPVSCCDEVSTSGTRSRKRRPNQENSKTRFYFRNFCFLHLPILLPNLISPPRLPILSTPPLPLTHPVIFTTSSYPSHLHHPLSPSPLPLTHPVLFTISS